MGGFIRDIRFDRAGVESSEKYPYSIPAIHFLETLCLHPSVTFFVGDNGTGKSTLLEAIAIAAGFNAEGGSKNFRFTTRASESKLHEYLRIGRGTVREKTGFFLRAESYFNLGTEIEILDRIDSDAPKIIESYGNRSLHEQSHGESFMALVRHRFGDKGLYILDEPEAALSPAWQLALLRHISDLVNQGSQFIIATHSPMLLAFPQAKIFEFGQERIREISYKESQPYQLVRGFLNDPERYMKDLFD